MDASSSARNLSQEILTQPGALLALALMKISFLLRRASLLAAALLHFCTMHSQGFTISLQEQGALTGSIVGGGGSVTINQIGVDYWKVIVQDARIGNPTSPPSNLAFTEPETVSGMTAYNNLQVLSVSPGTLTFDVLSDEFSPYSTIVGNGATAPFQGTDMLLII